MLATFRHPGPSLHRCVLSRPITGALPCCCCWPVIFKFITAWTFFKEGHTTRSVSTANTIAFLGHSNAVINYLGTSKKCLDEVYTYYWSHNCVKSCDFIYILNIMAAAASVSGAIMVSYNIHYINIFEQFPMFQYISNGFSNRYKLHSDTF